MAHPVSKKDIQAFVNACVFGRAVYMHYRWMFAPHFQIADVPKDVLKTVAPILYGDLNRVLVEYIIICACRLTDRGKKNLAVPFFTENCRFSDQRIRDRFTKLSQKIFEFRELIQPARNKFGAHLDREAHAKGDSLGGASFELWNRFWLDLQAYVEILSQHMLGQTVLICAQDSDGPRLLHAAYQGHLLQAELDKGICSLDEGKGAPLDIEEFIRERQSR